MRQSTSLASLLSLIFLRINHLIFYAHCLKTWIQWKHRRRRQEAAEMHYVRCRTPSIASKCLTSDTGWACLPRQRDSRRAMSVYFVFVKCNATTKPYVLIDWRIKYSTLDWSIELWCLATNVNFLGFLVMIWFSLRFCILRNQTSLGHLFSRVDTTIFNRARGSSFGMTVLFLLLVCDWFPHVNEHRKNYI